MSNRKTFKKMWHSLETAGRHGSCHSTLTAHTELAPPRLRQVWNSPESTWLCLSPSDVTHLLHWHVLEPITRPRPFHCSQTWCKCRGGETRQNFHRFRNEKGIPVCHTWRLSAVQSIWKGTTVTGRPTARLKSRKPKGSSSFPDPI